MVRQSFGPSTGFISSEAEGLRASLPQENTRYNGLPKGGGYVEG